MNGDSRGLPTSQCVFAHSRASPEVSRAFLAMPISSNSSCTVYFCNNALSPFSHSLTPYFQMFTLPTQDQNLHRETPFLHLPRQPRLVEPTLATVLQLGDVIKARRSAKLVVYLELRYLPACPLSSALLPASSRSLPWAFSGGICWQGTARMDLSAMQDSLLLQLKGVQAH